VVVLDKRQKSLSIPLDLWVRVVAEYEARMEYWADRGVRSSTGLIRHYVNEGLSGNKDEIQAIKAELQELREIVMRKLAEEAE